MPTEYDPEISGQVLVMIIGTLIVFLNLGTYIKVSVRFGLFLITIQTYLERFAICLAIVLLISNF